MSSLPEEPTARQGLRWWHWLLLAILLPVLALGGYITFVINRHYLPRFDLPAFNAAKAAQLSPEKRAAYEQELFSELSRWNKDSRRYPSRDDFIWRERRWQQMADEGVELAHITLEVLRPSILQVYALGGPVKHLEKLAEQGNVPAMCLMPSLVVNASSKLNIERYHSIYKKWMERGADLGHPECLQQLGGRLARGLDGYPTDLKRGVRLDFAARRAGYAHDVLAQTTYYRELERAPRAGQSREYVITRAASASETLAYRDLANVRRLYCWHQIDAMFWITNAPGRLLADLQSEALRTNRRDLAELYDELRGKRYSLQDCVNLGMGE